MSFLSPFEGGTDFQTPHRSASQAGVARSSGGGFGRTCGLWFIAFQISLFVWIGSWEAIAQADMRQSSVLDGKTGRLWTVTLSEALTHQPGWHAFTEKISKMSIAARVTMVEIDGKWASARNRATNPELGSVVREEALKEMAVLEGQMKEARQMSDAAIKDFQVHELSRMQGIVEKTISQDLGGAAGLVLNGSFTDSIGQPVVYGSLPLNDQRGSPRIAVLERARIMRELKPNDATKEYQKASESLTSSLKSLELKYRTDIPDQEQVDLINQIQSRQQELTRLQRKEIKQCSARIQEAVQAVMSRTGVNLTIVGDGTAPDGTALFVVSSAVVNITSDVLLWTNDGEVPAGDRGGALVKVAQTQIKGTGQVLFTPRFRDEVAFAKYREWVDAKHSLQQAFSLQIAPELRRQMKEQGIDLVVNTLAKSGDEKLALYANGLQSLEVQ